MGSSLAFTLLLSGLVGGTLCSPQLVNANRLGTVVGTLNSVPGSIYPGNLQEFNTSSLGQLVYCLCHLSISPPPKKSPPGACSCTRHYI